MNNIYIPDKAPDKLKLTYVNRTLSSREFVFVSTIGSDAEGYEIAFINSAPNSIIILVSLQILHAGLATSANVVYEVRRK